MIPLDDNALGAITNARALLDTMLANGWAEVCVTGRDGDYFLARHAGIPDPLVAPPPVAPAVAPAPASLVGTLRPVETLHLVRAPHVGTVVWLAPPGTVVGVDDAAARLQVLDEIIEVPAGVVGVVRSHGAAIDALAEFATVLVELVG